MRWLSGANATCPRDLQYGDPTTAGTDDDNSRVCTVSGSSVDAVFVSAASVLLFAVFSRRLLLSAVWLFLIGFSAAAIVYGFFDNTSRLSNGFSLWLNASTGDMLVYVFLPGLLLYESLRMDFHQFKTYLVQSIVFSFLVALGSTALLCVVMLWALDLGSQGWTNAHAGLFGAILASTDAASVVSRIMKSSLVGAPEHLTYMLRGESLFNNGISMVLFNIFLGHVNAIYSGNEPLPVPELLGEVAKDLVIASSSGIALGFFFAVAYHLFGGFLKRCPCIREGEDDLTTLTLAVAYVCFYVAQAPATSSGPIAVVVFGLYGAWTGKYGLSGSYLQLSGNAAVYEAIVAMFNAVAFFSTGLAFWSFLQIALHTLRGAAKRTLLSSSWIIVVIFVMSFVFRFLFTALSQSLFKVAGKMLDVKAVAFTTIAGLRGMLPLLLLRVVIDAPLRKSPSGEINHDALLLQAQTVIWAACFIVLTLVLNGPALGPLLKGLRLSKQNRGKSLMNERMRVLYESIIRKHLSDMQAAFDASHGYRVDWDLVRRVQDVNMPLDTSQLDRRHPQPCNRLWAWLRRPRVFASKTNGEVEGGSNTDVEASTSTSVEAMEGISLWGTKCDLRCLHFLPSIVRHGTSGGEEASPACVERSVSLTPPNVHRHSMPTTESIAVPKHLHASPTAHELIPSPTANAKDAASDARVRLYASLKHRFAQSHASGQISQQTYMVLQRLCDSSIFEADMPLDICAQLREESRTQLRVRLADMCLAVLRRMGMSRLARPLLVLREQSLLQATEALGEYATALEAASAQIGPAQTLAEISSELRHIHLYLWGRELECPAMYYAQLTHRAALSMLGKRMAVVSNLADQGLLDDQEHKVIHRPLRERLHSLRRTGVQVHIPIPREMMSSLPFLKCLPQEERNAILGKVTTTTFGPGTVVMGTTSGPGLHAPMEPAGCSPAKACPANETEIQMLMVGDGLLETACEDADEKTYWGRGGVIGLLPTLIASAPGAKPRETGVNGKLRAVVVPVDIHNRLTPDALVLGLPLEVFRDIRQRSANGDKRMKLAELNAFRLAAIAELHLPEHKSVVLHELRRRAEQRLTSASPGVRSLPHPATEAIAQGTAPGDIDPDALAMDRAVEQKAQGQFADVLSAITTSLLVEVPPGGMIVSDYPVLVLGGHVSRHAPFAGAEGPGARPDIKPPNHRRPPSIAPGKDALAPAISFIQEEELQAFGVAFPPDLHGDTRVAPQGMPTQSTLQGACQKLIAGGNSGATVLLLSAPSGDPAM